MTDVPAASYLAVANWDLYQHYRDRAPTWIKLQTSTLHDKKVRSLSLDGQLLWYDVLQLAGYYDNAIPNVPEAIARETGIPGPRVVGALQELMDRRLVRVTATARRASTAALRKRRKTGWRRTKSMAAEHYVRDPEGVDRPPPWFTGKAA